MKLRRNLTALSILLAVSATAAEVTTLNPVASGGTEIKPKTSTQDLTVPAGSVAEILTAVTNSGSNAVMNITIQGKITTINLDDNGSENSGPEFTKESPLTVSGPATIAVTVTSVYNTSSSLVTVKTQSSSEYFGLNHSVSATGVPSNAVVIPEDSAGSVEIIMESSIDLITWTAAMPGTYGQSTDKRFFRVRAVNIP